MSKVQEIEIPRRNEETFEVEIRGKTPYISNAFGARAVQEMLDKKTGKTTKRKKLVLSPEEDAKDTLRMADDGVNYGVPAAAFKSGMVRAAKGSCFTMKDMKHIIEVEGISLPLLNSETPAKYKVDYLIVPAQPRGKTPKWVAIFHEWKVVVPITYDADLITKEQVLGLLDKAGGFGIGGWRKEQGGNYGKYVLA